MKKFYDFSGKDITGNEINFDKFKGKKVLVVNTASECGFTPQYQLLQDLYSDFGGDGFEIVGFPANNFGGQEPGTEEEIKAFCEKNFGVTFTMMGKVSVKGEDQHPVFKWLTTKEENGVENVEIKWNFQKFMIDEEGNYEGYLAPDVSPASDELMDWINGL